MRTIKKGLLIALLSFALPLIAFADQLIMDIDNEHQLSAALTIGNLKTELALPSSQYSTRIQQLVFSLAERVGPSTLLGLGVGKSILTQTNRGLTAGKTLAGSVFELGLQQNLWKGQRWQFDLLVDYSYQLLDHSNPTQSLEMGIHQATATTSLSRNQNGGGKLLFGLRLHRLWGEEIASGTINHSLSLESKVAGQGYLGFEFALDNSGSIGVLLNSGDTDSSNLFFKRQF